LEGFVAYVRAIAFDPVFGGLVYWGVAKRQHGKATDSESVITSILLNGLCENLYDNLASANTR
jgi:hypothetical protein